MPTDDDEEEPLPPSLLTKRERWNILFLVLAFSCVVASLTLIVGTGAVVIRSVGGSNSIAPFALAVFFMGMSSISLTATHWIFAAWGRRVGFWCGCAIALIGVALACYGAVESSPTIVLIAQAFLGAGSGMGMYLRFAAVEVVPPNYSARAITWVLCGGCLAAFAGPEAAQATNGAFGDDNLTYLGVFVVAGCFYVAQACFVGLIQFPEPKQTEATEKRSETIITKEELDAVEEASPVAAFWSILKRPDFYLPVAVAVLSWSLMAMPMSIFRVVMKELGFTGRQSLTVIEFHFLAMYAPGFWSGKFIAKYGPVRSTVVSIISFLVGTAINLSSQDNANTSATWFLGLIFLGIGWNFGFSSATIWVTQSYQHAPHLKAKIQAANECLTFLFSGGAIFSTGYLYEDAGGGGIDGWRILNYTLLGLLSVMFGTVLVAQRLAKKKAAPEGNDTVPDTTKIQGIRIESSIKPKQLLEDDEV